MDTTQNFTGRSPQPPSEQLLSLCMIVKNEEHSLGDCLRSVMDVVDEIIIVDTGSTDGTVAIAESYNAQVFHFAWNGNFSDARNEALAHCTCRYVLHLDADERLDRRDRDRLRTLVRRPSSDVYELRIVSPMTEGKRKSRIVADQPRLFRRDPRYRYSYRIHENILPSVKEAYGVITQEDITILHVGYDVSDEAIGQKKIRNFELLVIDAREHPNDLHIMKKYAQTLLVLGQYDEAASRIQSMVQKIDGGICGDVSCPARAAFYNLYADALMKTGDYIGAAHWANESLRALNVQNMAHYFLMKIYDHLEKYDEALLHLNAIVLQRTAGDVWEAEDDVTPVPEDVCYKRAALYRVLKRPADERRELVAALGFDPRMTGALYRLAAFMEREQNFAEALSLVTRARETDPGDGAIVSLRARILLRLGRNEEALRDAATAYHLGEAGDLHLRQWIQTAKAFAREADALPAFALLLERHPEEVDLLLSYIQLLVQMPDIPAAAEAINRSLPFVTDADMRQVLTTIHNQLSAAHTVC